MASEAQLDAIKMAWLDLIAASNLSLGDRKALEEVRQAASDSAKDLETQWPELSKWFHYNKGGER